MTNVSEIAGSQHRHIVAEVYRLPQVLPVSEEENHVNPIQHHNGNWISAFHKPE